MGLDVAPVRLEIVEMELHRILAILDPATDGDDNEKLHCRLVSDQFPKYEHFWRDLVVPTTNRIVRAGMPRPRHERREHIADDLWGVTCINYSIFLNLVGAFEHLATNEPFAWQLLYAHCICLRTC